MAEYTQGAAQVRWICRMGTEARQVDQAVVGAARELAMGIEEGRGEFNRYSLPWKRPGPVLMVSTAGTRKGCDADLLVIQL
jgi:hypothetical protein